MLVSDLGEKETRNLIHASMDAADRSLHRKPAEDPQRRQVIQTHQSLPAEKERDC